MKHFRASLSGSGARLGWHVGVLLGYQEDLGWDCTEYRGVSGGGLVAVMAACGRLQWFAELLRSIRTEDIYRGAGLLGLWRGYRYVLDPMDEVFEAHGIGDFTVQTPCRLTMFDLLLRQSVHHWLRPGDPLREHRDAIFGTLAVPGIFPPTYHGRWVDGGVTDMVPGFEPMAVLLAKPWIVSVASAITLAPLDRAPTTMKHILLTVLDGISCETVRNDLVMLESQTHRLHVLPRADAYATLEFDPVQSSVLIAAGRSDVLQSERP